LRKLWKKTKRVFFIKHRVKPCMPRPMMLSETTDTASEKTAHTQKQHTLFTGLH